MPPLTLAFAHAAHRKAGRSFLCGLLALSALRRQRIRLAELDPHILRDIGLTPDQARAEAARPVWDVPAHGRG